MSQQENLAAYRPYLFSVAYNILGEIQEAEDIVQDSFEYMLSLPSGHVQHEKAFLSRVVANKSIDRLKARKQVRKLYPGVWLPEPYVQPEEFPATREKPLDILSYSLLCLIEQLNPIERAVFILREAFDYSYQALAELCSVSEANCRQILSRARKKINYSARRKQADQHLYHQLLNTFLQAWNEDNPDALARILKEDIILYSDGGGKAPAAMVPLRGLQTVIKFLQGTARKQTTRQLTVRKVQINQQPGLLFSMGDIPDTLLCFDTDGASIQHLFIMRNPEKIFIP